MNHVLDYAPRPPLHRRKLFRRAVGGGLVAILLMVALLNRRWIAASYHRVRLLRYQQQCLSYAGPADQIVYTDEPDMVKRLVAGKGGYVLMTHTQPLPRYDFVFLPVGPWQRFVAEESGPSATAPYAPLLDYMPHLLIHGMAVPGGQVQLVELDFLQGEDEKLSFVAYVRPLRTFRDTGPASGFEQVLYIPIPPRPQSTQPSRSLRFYAGQFNSADPSSATVGYEYAGGSGHLVLRLRAANGYPVPALSVLDGPLKTP